MCYSQKMLKIRKIVTLLVFALALFAAQSISAQSSCRFASDKFLPIVVSAPRPPYTAEAIVKKAKGDVLVDVTIDASGNFTQAIFVSGNELLKNPALISAKRWKFNKVKTEDSVRSVRLTFSFFLNLDDYEEQDKNEIQHKYHLNIYRNSAGCSLADPK